MNQKFSTNPTLNTLIAELGVECQRAVMLVHQLQLPNISDRLNQYLTAWSSRQLN